MPTGHRGEPFLSVTTRAHKTIYDNGFPGVCAICPRTVAGAAGGAEAGVASAPPEKPYVGGTGDVRKRAHAHIVRLPPQGSNRALRTFFERYLGLERAARADVAIVYGLNEVHDSFFDALAAGKPPTADQAAWLVHRLEHGVLGSELAHLANAHDGAYSHGVQANASANGAPRRRLDRHLSLHHLPRLPHRSRVPPPTNPLAPSRAGKLGGARLARSPQIPNPSAPTPRCTPRLPHRSRLPSALRSVMPLGVHPRPPRATPPLVHSLIPSHAPPTRHPTRSETPRCSLHGSRGRGSH